MGPDKHMRLVSDFHFHLFWQMFHHSATLHLITDHMSGVSPPPCYPLGSSSCSSVSIIWCHWSPVLRPSWLTDITLSPMSHLSHGQVCHEGRPRSDWVWLTLNEEKRWRKRARHLFLAPEQSTFPHIPSLTQPSHDWYIFRSNYTTTLQELGKISTIQTWSPQLPSLSESINSPKLYKSTRNLNHDS